MRLIWLSIIFLIASCRAINTNDHSGSDRQRDHLIEITFLNSEGNYSAVITAIQKNVLIVETQNYPVNTIYPSLTVLSVRCGNLSEIALSRLKAALGSCTGVVNVRDIETN